MSTKQRGIVFQRWCGVLQRETRDLTSLGQISSRALADSDVRDDPILQTMIRAEVQKRRVELEQKLQDEIDAATPQDAQPSSRTELPESAPTTTPEQDRKNFNRLVRSLSKSLERSKDKETQAILAKMQALQQRRPEVIPATALVDYERRVEELRAHVKQLSDEILLLTQRAVAAAKDGDEQVLVRSMRRLTAIHAAHPQLLDEPGLEDVRRDVADAADERLRHQRTTKKLLTRERAISAEINTLAAAVREFHRVATNVPATSEAFRNAEATYVRTIREVRTYDAEWFSGVVLELADLLAEWTVPPLEAEGQIDRFLDSIDAGLDRIRAEMREIKSKTDSDKRNGSKPTAP